MAVQLGSETQSPKAVMLETKNDLRFSSPSPSPSPNRFPSDWRLSSPSPQRFSTSSWQSLGTPIRDADDEAELQWAAVGRLQGNGGSPEKHLLVDVVEEARQLLEKMKERLKRVDLEFPNIEVQFKNLSVEASCEVVAGKPLPTLWNTTKTTFKGFARILGFKTQEANVSILKDVSGIIKPSRMTLLLGPPGCGKTTLLLALSGRLSQNHKIRVNITYNGFKLEEFVPEKTSAYINQYDVHIPQMTVKETLDFAARCQGSANGEDIMKEVQRREVQAGIIPDLDINTSMKETSSMGQNQTLPTDHILKILGLESCANTLVGDAMIQGISGGQKRRLTTGEMIIGPARALFMDEISNGLDSSTTFQVISYIQQLVHITEVTALITLLQPAPETFELFDEIILMSEGKIIYHGLRCHVLDFFEDCGFKCPQRKGVADFLQEVISRKDQQQYWYRTDMAYNYVSADHFLERFKISHIGKKLNDELSKPCERSQSQQKALSFNTYSVPRWQLFKICMDREVLLMKRDAFIYVFKMIQLGITALITMTVFFRANMKVDRQHAEYYIGAMFYTIVRIAMNGIAELSFTVSRLAVFYRQRASHFFPAWAYSVPSSILKIPISFLEALLWTSLTYYVIGYTPEAERFFGQFMVLFVLHQESTALFRFLASISQTPIAAAFSANLVLLTLCLLSGFILPRAYFPAWLNWLFWVTPMTYSEIGIAINEFEAPRWKEISSQNMALGEQVLRSHGLNFERYFYWLSLGAAFGFTILFNFGFIMAMTCLNPPETSRFIASNQQNHLHREEENSSICTQACTTSLPQNTTQMQKGRMSLPFEPLTMAFQNVQYCVDTAQELRELGVAQKKLQLLCDITGAFRPGVLTALMGVTGAGKTTLMDVLSGRKTTGYIEGDVRVGGYTKVQEAFARVSGYCEQTDIHSPYITVKESVLFSAWLRLPPEIDQLTKTEFVEEVLQTIELDNIRDAIVGMPGFSGLSTEQRKRLTIAVELVSNPSVIFMDEPTTGLDARAAAIVMRAVKNTANTGRTVVCTIHQPSIDIFEAFDELLLMKRGGQIIYSGPLGQHSSQLIEYFEGISSIPKIKDNYNPATWMLEVTSASVEEQLGVDFAHIYKNSDLYRRNHELIEQQKKPPLGSKKLQFLTDFPQGEWEQYKACLWKQHHSYWRNPSYNFTRFMFTIIVSIVNATVLCQRGKKIENAQDLFNIFSGTIITLIMLGLFNSTTVIPVVATERAVFYRERFAGMYTSWASSFAQVTIEIPYVILQAAVLVCITYPSVGYYWSVYKVIWYFYSVTSILAVSTYLGMFFMSLSPNAAVANILTAAYFTLLTLFAGFLIPRPEIPKWWIWAYWICPSAWTANGFLTSQYGDITKEIQAYGQFKPLNAFLRDFYGFHANYLSIVAIILVFFPITLASLFAYFTKKSNFQRR